MPLGVQSTEGALAVPQGSKPKKIRQKIFCYQLIFNILYHLYREFTTRQCKNVNPVNMSRSS